MLNHLHGTRLVREFIPDVVLGLFVHTPFPSSEIFRCLPRTSLPFYSNLDLYNNAPPPGRKEILDGMLGANLICFQVRRSSSP
jgi:trehalose 6-phosphate synthase/phosphatase